MRYYKKEILVESGYRMKHGRWLKGQDRGKLREESEGISKIFIKYDIFKVEVECNYNRKDWSRWWR